MALKYGMQKRMAKGGQVCEMHGTHGCMMCHGGKMAEGGDVGDASMPKEDDGSDGIVDRIMKRFAKGGAVEQETPPIADGEEAQYDDIVDMEDTEADETGANSGDEIGDAAEDEDERDIVKRIMKSRGKKDKMPRPA